MTLNSRNKLLLILWIIMASITFALVTTFIIFLIIGKIDIFSFDHGFFHFIFKETKLASILSHLLLLLYSVITLYGIYRAFEKTPSPEAIYFNASLLGTFFTGLRFCIPLFQLSLSYSVFYATVAKIAFAGQIILLISFLCASLFNKDSQVLLAETNFVIIVALGTVFAQIIPLNLTKTNICGIPSFAFSGIFIGISSIIVIFTVTSFLIFWKGLEKKENILISVGYVFIMLGFFSLSYAKSLFIFIIATIFLSVGTKLYLSQIHNYYLWK
ncbi:MAG: hypothetical protein GX220_02520 [Treponema sp.]|nr:hypothetical protein [Treponema sp.]